MDERYGLEWEDMTFGSEPRWTAEPDTSVIQSLSREHLQLAEDARCTVSFHAQGAFNKLYKVDTDFSTWLMRVALPVDPHRKTASEVATIEFIRDNTDCPVPKVIAFDSSNNNALRFEWILMEFVAGQPLYRAWRKLPTSSKEALVKQLALYQSQLFHQKFHVIGSLYTDIYIHPHFYKIDSMVTMHFFWGDRAARSFPRGPFRNSREWFEARLGIVLDEQNRVLEKTTDEDEIEDAEASKSLAEQLLAVLPKIFPPDEDVSSVIFHDDLSMQNILVDDLGNLVGIVDWECVSAFPLWRACQFPSLLDGRVRVERPHRETYGSAEEDYDDGVDEKRPDALDNEGVSTLYWEHLLEYERGQLRAMFLAEMEGLQPEWVWEWRRGSFKRDFERAILNVDRSWGLRGVQRWLDAYMKGEPGSLSDQFF